MGRNGDLTWVRGHSAHCVTLARQLLASSLMHLPAVATTSTHSLDDAALRALIRAEYREMPGLSVTLAQAARLWNVNRQQCLTALESLRHEGFLRNSRDSYLRVSCGRASA